VEAVLERVAPLVAEGDDAAGMTSVDGIATVVHVRRTLESDVDAHSLQAAVAHLLEAAFRERLRCAPAVAVQANDLAAAAQG
jgi:hypothetical protein